MSVVIDSCDDVVALIRSPAPSGIRIVRLPFDVDAMTSLFRNMSIRTSMGPFEVDKRIGSLVVVSESRPRMPPFEVEAFRLPLTASTVMPPLDVFAVTEPSMLCRSIAPFEVRTLIFAPRMRASLTAPFDVTMSAAPSMSCTLIEPFDDFNPDNSVCRGALITKRAPQLQRFHPLLDPEGRVALTRTRLPSCVDSTCTMRNWSGVSAYFWPVISIVLVSQPVTSIDPLKPETSRRPLTRV